MCSHQPSIIYVLLELFNKRATMLIIDINVIDSNHRFFIKTSLGFEIKPFIEHFNLNTISLFLNAIKYHISYLFYLFSEKSKKKNIKEKKNVQITAVLFIFMSRRI